MGPPAFATAPAGKRLLLLTTANVQGYVEPCGCTGDPLGGIARLAGLVDDAREAFGERVLLLDGGNLLFEKPDDNAAVDRCQAEARTDLLVSTYARLGLAATTRGPLDDVRGPDFYDALLARHGVTSLRHTQSTIVRRGDVTVLVIGANDTDTAASINTAVATAVSATPVDLVVLLYQQEVLRTKALAPTLTGVDVVVVGRAGETPSPPERVGGVTIVQPGWQAQHVGVVEIVLDGRVAAAPLALDDRAAVADGRKKLLDVRIAELNKLLPGLSEGATRTFQQQRLERFVTERTALDVVDTTPMAGPHLSVRALPLRRGISEEPTAFAALKTYELAIPTLVSSCEATAVCPEPGPEVRRYVGAATCQTCHAAAWDFWQKALVEVVRTGTDGVKRTERIGHVKAWETLVHAGRDKDRSCVGCHSAGFDVEGGACTTTKLVEQQLTAVQCESCHGAGSAHVAAGGDKALILNDVPEATCRGCHVPPHIESAASFVFNERLLHILGDGHGEKRRASLLP